MSGVIGRRAPTDDERLGILDDVRDLAWRWARELADLGDDDDSFFPYTGGESDDQKKQDAALALLAAQNQLLQALAPCIPETVTAALEYGADFEDLAVVLGVSRQAVEKRWGYLRRSGERVAVVISRRDRVREHPDDPRGRVGEVGGAEQYDNDRGIWPIGEKVRAEAKYAVVAVDGSVRRVYEIAPDSWEEVQPRLWQFDAVGDRALTAEEIDAAYGSGELPLRPSDDCPTRAGGAYRPHWF